MLTGVEFFMIRRFLPLLLLSCRRADTDYQFWHAMGGPLGDALRVIVSKTNIKEVNLGSYSTLSQRLVSFALFGHFPLIAQTFPSWTVEFYKKDLIVPAEEILPENLLSKIHPKLLEEVKLDGKIYSIPFNKSVPVIFYNADLMEKLNLKVPKTWEELKEVCVSAKKKGIWGFAFPKDPWIFYAIFKQKGGRDIDFNSKEGIESLKFLRDLVLKDSCAYVVSGYSHQDDFANQKVLMIWATSASYVFMKPKVEFRMGVSPIPVDRYDSVVISGTNITVFRGHSEEEYMEVIRLFEVFLNDSVQRFWSSSTAYLPITDPELGPEDLKEAFRQVDRATYEPRSEVWMRARRYFSTEVMEPVLFGVLDVETALIRFEKLLRTLE